MVAVIYRDNFNNSYLFSVEFWKSITFSSTMNKQLMNSSRLDRVSCLYKNVDQMQTCCALVIIHLSFQFNTRLHCKIMIANSEKADDESDLNGQGAHMHHVHTISEITWWEMITTHNHNYEFQVPSIENQLNGLRTQ